MTDFITFGISGLLMIGVLVVIHELGHFLFAKLFGVGVPVFSVGMGPRLFGFHYRGTDYRVSALPVGGYVQMSGADPFGEEDTSAVVDPDQDFMRKPVWQRLLVMLGGPGFNLALPFLVFTALLMSGEPQAAPVVGVVLEGSLAEQQGLRPGDRVAAVDGQPVVVFSDVFRRMKEQAGDAVQLDVRRGDQQLDVRLPLPVDILTDDGLVDLERVGLLTDRRSTRFGVDDPSSPAARAGLRTGDAVLAVDGVDVRTWEDLAQHFAASGSWQLEVLRIVRDEPEQRLQVTLTTDGSWAPPPDDPWGNAWGVTPSMVYVGRVSPDSAAMDAGMRTDDRLWSLDGDRVRSWTDLHQLVARSMEGRTEAQGPRSLDVVVVRAGERHALTLTPRITREIVRGDVRYRPLMGVERYPSAYVPGPRAKKYYSFTEAVPLAIQQGREVLKLTFNVFYKLLTRDLRPQEAVGGPVEIFRAAGESAQAGIHTFARTLGTISFSLGIVNLLPVPVLDGGQIVFYAIEGIRGRPLSVRIRERMQIVGVLGLIALMLLVTVMDVNRWLGAWWG